MEQLSVKEARQAASVGKQATVRGWVRTRRDSKGGFSFLEVNDGSCLANIQIVADAKLPNYESEVKQLSAGCSVTVRGEVKASGGKEQATEVHAARDHRPRLGRSRGVSAAEEAALVREAPRMGPPAAADEYVRRGRPRAEPHLPVDPRLLSGRRLSLPAHADHHGQRLRRGRGDVPRHDARSGQAAANGEGRRRLRAGLFPSAGVPHRLRPAGRRDLRHGAGQGLHVRPHVPRRELEHHAAPGRVLDGRAGSGVLRTRRQHGAGRAILEADLPRRAGRLPGGSCSFLPSTSTKRCWTG